MEDGANRSRELLDAAKDLADVREADAGRLPAAGGADQKHEAMVELARTIEVREQVFGERVQCDVPDSGILGPAAARSGEGLTLRSSIHWSICSLLKRHVPATLNPGSAPRFARRYTVFSSTFK